LFPFLIIIRKGICLEHAKSFSKQALIKCPCQNYPIQNEAYLKNAKPKFQKVWAEGADKEGSENSEKRKQCQRIKKKYTVHSLSPQGYSEFIILSRMDVQNHTILQ